MLCKTSLTLQVDCVHPPPQTRLSFLKRTPLESLIIATGDPKEKQKNPPQEAWGPRVLAGPRAEARGDRAAGTASGEGGGSAPRLLPAHLPPNPTSLQQKTRKAGIRGSAQSPFPPPGGADPGPLREGRGAAGPELRRVPGVTCTAMAVMLRPCSAARSSSRPPAAPQRRQLGARHPSRGAERGGWRAGEREGAIKAEPGSPGRARLTPPPSATRLTLSQRGRPGGAPGQGRRGGLGTLWARTLPEPAGVPRE